MVGRRGGVEMMYRGSEKTGKKNEPWYSIEGSYGWP